MPAKNLFTKKSYVIYGWPRSEEHTSELQSRFDLVCRLLLEKKKNARIYVQPHADKINSPIDVGASNRYTNTRPYSLPHTTYTSHDSDQHCTNAPSHAPLVVP